MMTNPLMLGVVMAMVAVQLEAARVVSGEFLSVLHYCSNLSTF